MKYLSNDLFDDIFTNMYGSYNTKNLTYDVIENADNYVVQFALPGFERDNVNVEVNNKTLIIRAERLFDDKLNFVKKSTTYGKIEKKFTLPEDVDPDVDAKFENGLLVLTLKRVNKNKIIKIR